MKYSAIALALDAMEALIARDRFFYLESPQNFGENNTLSNFVDIKNQLNQKTLFFIVKAQSRLLKNQIIKKISTKLFNNNYLKLNKCPKITIWSELVLTLK